MLMDQNGILGGDDPMSARFRDAIVSALRDSTLLAPERHAQPSQQEFTPRNLDEIKNYLRSEVLLAMKPGQNEAGKEQEVPSIPLDATVAELRAQLAEARNDTKLAEAISRSDVKHTELIGRMEAGFADVKGHISAANARLDGIERSTVGLRTAIFGTGVAAVAVVIAILAYGQAWFGIGVSTRDIVRATVTELLQAKPSAPSVSPAHWWDRILSSFS
jgi:hypothetical protein